MLVNLAPTVPTWFASYARVAEVVSEDPLVKAAGRERFRTYRASGFEPETHKIGAER
ncbi:DNA polymerase III subunit chi [compost metagenome]